MDDVPHLQAVKDGIADARYLSWYYNNCIKRLGLLRNSRLAGHK